MDEIKHIEGCTCDYCLGIKIDNVWRFKIDNADVQLQVNCLEPCCEAPPCQVFKPNTETPELYGKTDNHELKIAILMCLLADQNCHFSYTMQFPGNIQRITFVKTGRVMLGTAR